MYTFVEFTLGILVAVSLFAAGLRVKLECQKRCPCWNSKNTNVAYVCADPKYINFVDLQNNEIEVSETVVKKNNSIANSTRTDHHDQVNQFVCKRHCCWVLVVLIANLFLMFGYTFNSTGNNI